MLFFVKWSFWGANLICIRSWYVWVEKKQSVTPFGGLHSVSEHCDGHGRTMLSLATRCPEAMAMGALGRAQRGAAVPPRQGHPAWPEPAVWHGRGCSQGYARSLVVLPRLGCR